MLGGGVGAPGAAQLNRPILPIAFYCMVVCVVCLSEMKTLTAEGDCIETSATVVILYASCSTMAKIIRGGSEISLRKLNDTGGGGGAKPIFIIRLKRTSVADPGFPRPEGGDSTR